MAKSDKKQRGVKPKRGFWGRFRRFWLYFFLIFFGLIVLAVLAVYVFLPPQFAREMAVKVVRQQFHRELEIETVRLNLLKGFEFNNISMQLPDSLQDNPDDFPVRTAFIKSALLRYDFFKLLSGRAVVREVVLDSPDIDLYLQAAQEPKAKTEPDTLPPPALPLDIELDEFSLRNATFHMVTESAGQQQVLHLSGLSLNVDDMVIPRGVLFNNDSTLSAVLQLVVDNGDLRLEVNSDNGDKMGLSSRVDLQANARLTTLDTLDLEMDLRLQQLQVRTPNPDALQDIRINEPLSLDLVAHYYYNEERIHVPGLNLRVGNNTWLGLRGFISGLTAPQPYVTLEVERGHVPLVQALDLARTVLPDSLLDRFYFRNPDAAITFTGSSLRGYLPDSLSRKGLQYTANADFLDFDMTVDQGAMQLENLNFTARSTGRMRYSGLEQLQAFANIKFDSLFYGISDTFNVYSGPGVLDMQAELNELLVPEIVNIDLDVANLVGAALDGHFVLTGTNSLQTLEGNGQLELSDVDSQNFPQMPLNTTGILKMDLRVNTLDSIFSRIELFTDSLAMPGIWGDETFPSVRLVNEAWLQADTTFQNISLDSMLLDLNNQVKATANGQWRGGGKEGFEFVVRDLRIDHPRWKEWLPYRKREQYASLDILGATHLALDLNGRMTDTQPEFTLHTRVWSEDTAVLYPEQFLSLRGIKLDVNSSITSDSTLEAKIALGIDSTYTDKVSGSAYLNNRISCQVISYDLQSLRIMNGILALPDLNGLGDFQVNIDDLASNPTIAAFFNFTQQAPSLKSVARNIAIQGNTDLQIVANMDTALLDVYATIKTDGLSVLLPADTRLDDINADLKIHQRMDLVKGVFLADDEAAISTPSQGSIDYMIFRDYYRNTLSDMSDLAIGRIQAGGYVLEDFTMEAVLGNGRVDIPTFLCNVYDGNLGGRLSVDLAGGDLAAARLSLSTHFSQVNSDRLLPGLRREETLGIINGNARFTGTGLDPQQNLDIAGYFHITEIGPRVADNLLRALDPEEKDSGILMTRTLINRGYKPKLFSFNLSHGFFSTTVELSQPWYYPIKLSGSKLSLARQPVQFFLNLATAKPQAGME